MRTQTISVDNLRRNFGSIKKKLPFVAFIVTDRGKPIAQVSAAPEIKQEMMEKTFGAWKGTELDDDMLWKEVLEKKSRKRAVSL
ncbi:MAG: hypothetical protein HY428_01300 [Candidatus Levybacteria bacterium]|nr:hypothetical protein [Candidatus Levybacteria bacterium]